MKKREREREVDCRGTKRGRDRARREGEERASGQGMLVGSLMRRAMHAPYGSDQISDRLPSPPEPFPSILAAASGTAKWTAPDRRIHRCIGDVEMLPSYKVRLMFDSGDDRSSVLTANFYWIKRETERAYMDN